MLQMGLNSNSKNVVILTCDIVILQLMQYEPSPENETAEQ